MSRNRKPQKLYTVYRSSDDALIAFEETGEKCAYLLGTTLSNFYTLASRSGRCGYTIIKSKVV